MTEGEEPTGRFLFELQDFQDVEIVQRKTTKIISNICHQLENAFQSIQVEQLVELKGEISHGDASSILPMILDVNLFHQNFLGRISQGVELVHLDERKIHLFASLCPVDRAERDREDRGLETNRRVSRKVRN